MAERIFRWSESDLPAAPQRKLQLDRSRLEKRAAIIGAALGRLVFLSRQARAIGRRSQQASISSRLGAFKEESKTRVESVRMASAQRAREAMRVTIDKTDELRHQARETYFRAVARADEIRREYPLHVAVAAGAAGFLAGVALRIRRSRHAH